MKKTRALAADTNFTPELMCVSVKKDFAVRNRFRRMFDKSESAAIVYIISLLLLLFSTSLSAKEYVYKMLSGSSESNAIVYLGEPAASGSREVSTSDFITKDSHIILLDKNYATSLWTFKKADGETLTFTRRENTIIAEGSHKGKNVSQTIKIDQNPFFASFDFGVSGFYLSAKDKSDFWTVNPENLKAYKMTITRMGVETITHANTKTEAIKIRISVAGMPAAFFSMFYWVRPSDGICVRVESYRGGPGSPKVISELLSEK